MAKGPEEENGTIPTQNAASNWKSQEENWNYSGHKRKRKICRVWGLFVSRRPPLPLPAMPVPGRASVLPSRGVGSLGVSPLEPDCEGTAQGILCSFSLSVKSKDFPTLRQPNPSHTSSRLGIWAPESARLCLLSSFLFILAPNRGFYTPLSPPNCCPPRLCQIPLFPRT